MDVESNDNDEGRPPADAARDSELPEALDVQVADEHPSVRADHRIVPAIRRVLREAGLQSAEVSVAVVDDETIHRLNRQYLDHDYATDVLSFLLDHGSTSLEGEIVVSADTARREAAAYGGTVHDELLLYVIHGALHLVGYDDQQEEDRRQMRLRERQHLAAWDVSLPHEDTATPGQAGDHRRTSPS